MFHLIVVEIQIFSSFQHCSFGARTTDEPFLPLGSYPEPFLNAELGSFGSDPDDLRPLGSSLEPFLDAALGSYPAELGSFASYWPWPKASSSPKSPEPRIDEPFLSPSFEPFLELGSLGSYPTELGSLEPLPKSPEPPREPLLEPFLSEGSLGSDPEPDDPLRPFGS